MGKWGWFRLVAVSFRPCACDLQKSSDNTVYSMDSVSVPPKNLLCSTFSMELKIIHWKLSIVTSAERLFFTFIFVFFSFRSHLAPAGCWYPGIFGFPGLNVCPGSWRRWPIFQTRYGSVSKANWVLSKLRLVSWLPQSESEPFEH